MNLAREQDKKLIHRNLLHFFIQIMKCQKKVKKIKFKITLKKNQIPTNKLNQGGERLLHLKR